MKMRYRYYFQDVISPEECFDKSDGICPPLALLKNTRAPGVDRSLASTASKSADSTMLPLPSGLFTQLFI